MKAIIFTAAIAAVGAPIQARAEGFVNPWAGVNFGSAKNFGSSVDNGRGAFGVNAGGMGAGVIGGEVAFGYSPSYFGTKTDFGNNTLIDLMGNLIVGVPVGGTHGAGFRPFVTGGLGLIRTQIDGGTLFKVSGHNNMAGWNLGAGAMGFFNDHVGARGELKYYRGFKDLVTGDTRFDVDGNNQLHYWRLGLGIVIR
jgi:hypothetical protein